MIMLGGFEVVVRVIVSDELENSVGGKPNPSVGGVGQLNPAHVGAIAVEEREDLRLGQFVDGQLVTS